MSLLELLDQKLSLSYKKRWQKTLKKVHFIVAACENMISGTGMRPGDILTASNGKTIEVITARTLVILPAVLAILIQPAIVPAAFATFQTAAGGPATAAVGGKLICTELLSSAWTGFFAGCLHTLSGSDHLTALAPLSIALENGECDVGVYESLNNPSPRKKKIGFATIVTGIVHGLQPDALMMVLPALALPSRLDSIMSRFEIGSRSMVNTCIACNSFISK